LSITVRPQRLLSDAHSRVARDLRVSLTDRCNLRCSYCMPADGLAWLPGPDVLTDDEVVRLITVAVTLLGVRKLRFTGGEPLLRRGLVGIVAASARLRTDENRRPELSLTTNGVGLDKQHRCAGSRGPGPRQRLARLPRPRPVRGAGPARPASRRPARLGGG
jgi:cyclic pyranopterin phosphate synthase